MDVANKSIIICEHEHEITQHIRVKRQQPGGGVGNFADAAKMPQMKSLRLFLQFFKNLWSNVYLGGSHPLHPNVPKTFVELYQEKVEKVFFPPAGGDPNKRPET
ncbi:uncharacterized protein LOC121730704 [Aricia agestis]|uniref:uncharacterized protein LOC121730704 n=1 Tax=Aricia agestis TaxID=91739 RepID=UPI001C204554|nr:uncharacterized protein LOC121730704 [Aricia agestis]